MGNDGNDQKGGSLWCKALLGIKGTREKYGGAGNDGDGGNGLMFLFLLKRYMGVLSCIIKVRAGGWIFSFFFSLVR